MNTCVGSNIQYIYILYKKYKKYKNTVQVIKPTIKNKLNEINDTFVITDDNFVKEKRVEHNDRILFLFRHV